MLGAQERLTTPSYAFSHHLGAHRGLFRQVIFTGSSPRASSTLNGVSIGLCAPFPAQGDFWPVDVLERERPRTNMHTGGELSQSTEPTRVQRGNVWSWLADPARGGRTGAEGSNSWQWTPRLREGSSESRFIVFLRNQRIYSGYTCNTSHYDVLAGVDLKTLSPLILNKALIHYVETRNASYRPLENAISTGASLAPVVSPGVRDRS